MMKDENLTNIKLQLECFYRLADKWDEDGTGELINHMNPEKGIRESARDDILLFVTSTVDSLDVTEKCFDLLIVK